MEFPYFPLYVKDWVLGTQRMTAEEVGGYLNLLIHQWDKGSLPDDISELEIISGVKNKKLSKILNKFQKMENGCLLNSRLEIVREEVRSRFATNRTNGGKGGRPSSKISEENKNPRVSDGLAMGNPRQTQNKPNKIEIEIEKEIDNTSVLSGARENQRPSHAPTKQAVDEIFVRLGRPEMSQGFFDYYEGLGWMAGQTKIVNVSSFANRWVSNPAAQKEIAKAATGRRVIMETDGREVPWTEAQYEAYKKNPNTSGYHFVRYE